VQLAKSGLEVELSCRSAVFLLVCHQGQITSSAALAPALVALRDVVVGTVGALRFLVGVDLAGLQYMHQRLVEDQDNINTYRTVLGDDGPDKKKRKVAVV
jgi:hypothetical protein